jgi:hypothetical protein
MNNPGEDGMLMSNQTAAGNDAIQEYFAITEKLCIKPREMEIWSRMVVDEHFKV